MWATGTKKTISSASSTKSNTLPSSSVVAVDASGDDWVLNANLQLCGTVLPPTYADLNTDAHLNTFDVNENGNAVLLGECGRLFILNVFQLPTAKKTQQKQSTRDAKQQKQQHQLLHLVLDPPLSKQEVKEVEQVKVNASGTYVILQAKKWIKVVELWAEWMSSTGLQSHGGNGSNGLLPPRRKKTSSNFLQREDQNIIQQHYCVRFDDGCEENITFRVESTDQEVDLDQLQTKLRTKGKKVVSISRELGSTTVRQVGYFNSICHAAWHSLSDSHLVVLSDAEEISIFNMNQDVSKPEQRYELDFKGKGRVSGAVSTSFCFGSAQMVWDIFTCYIVRSDGSIYALCPLVPYDCRVSSHVISTLRNEVESHIAVCKNKLEGLNLNHNNEHTSLQKRFVELKSQKYWLQEAWGATSLLSENSPGDRETGTGGEFYRHLKPHITGISPDTWPLDLQGPVEVTPKSIIEGKNNVQGGASAASVLVVPHMLRNDKKTVLTPFLMRSFTSGHVELVLLDAPIRPQWKSDKHYYTRKMTALLLECLNLGIDDSGGKAVLERDPADPRLVYCLHSTGVHVINVSWVFALAAGKQFTSLPKSSVRHIFSVSPSVAPLRLNTAASGFSTPPPSSSTSVSNVVGARVVKSVYFGHLMLLRLASGNFEVVNVSAASSELLKGVKFVNDMDVIIDADGKPEKHLSGTLASMATSKSRSLLTSTSASTSSGMKPFGDIVEEKVEVLAARGTRVTGKTYLHEVDDAVLAFVIERVKILYEDIQYIDEMDQLMKDRLSVHREMIKNQTEKALVIRTSVDAAKASLNTLQEKMERALAVQQNLRKRAAAVLQAVKENQPQLSRAERELRCDLDEMGVEVRRLKPRVTQLTVSGQRMARNLENTALQANTLPHHRSAIPTLNSGGVLSEDKKKMCYEVLRAETQLIEDTKALIEEMSASLQHLKV